MGNNQKASSFTKLYRIVVLWTRTNHDASFSTKPYRRAVPRTTTNYILRRNTNHNAILRNKKTQMMRLLLMCQNILTPLTYSNAEEIFWTYLTCHMKESAWPLQEKYSLRRCWILYSNIIILKAHHCPVKISNKHLADSWKKKKKMPNVKSITLLRIIFQSSITINAQKKNAGMSLERRIALSILS